MLRGLCTLVVAASLLGCGGREAYRCTSSDQCVEKGSAGTCETTGFCSFADPSCPSGRKYEASAGDGLGGTCVGDEPIDAQPCIADVAFGRHFGCVLKKDGTVWCAGANQNGQIGFGLAGDNPVLQWMAVRDATTSITIDDATAIGAGANFACAARAGGALWCWGHNEFGMLGNNDASDSPAAVQVRRESDDNPLTNIVEVSGGIHHACARDGGGDVYCWGRNDLGQLGDGSLLQQLRAVPTITEAAALSVGRDQACVRKTNGEAWCWGKNNDGQVGDGSSTNKDVPVMVGRVKSIEVGGYAICRINTDDTVSCSGNPWRGRVGNGLSNASPDVTTPEQVLTGPEKPPLAGVAQLALGGASCARLIDGSVKCWSDNTHGQTGAGAASPFPTAVRLGDGTPLVDVDRIVAHFSHLCAFRSAGDLVCWGRGLSGEFGDGKLEDRGAAARLELACP